MPVDFRFFGTISFIGVRFLRGELKFGVVSIIIEMR